MLATLGVVFLIVGASAACAATHAPRYASTIEWLAGVLVIVGLAAIGGQLGAFVR